MTDTTRQELLALAIRLEVEDAPRGFSEKTMAKAYQEAEPILENIPTEVLHQKLLENYSDEVVH